MFMEPDQIPPRNVEVVPAGIHANIATLKAGEWLDHSVLGVHLLAEWSVHSLNVEGSAIVCSNSIMKHGTKQS